MDCKTERSSPCLNCKDRQVEPNCHGYCEKWLAWKENQVAVLKAMKKDRAIDGAIADVRNARVRKRRV